MFAAHSTTIAIHTMLAIRSPSLNFGPPLPPHYQRSLELVLRWAYPCAALSPPDEGADKGVEGVDRGVDDLQHDPPCVPVLTGSCCQLTETEFSYAIKKLTTAAQHELVQAMNIKTHKEDNEPA